MQTPTHPDGPPRVDTEERALLSFDWERTERWHQSRLLRFFATSVLAHLLVFQLFQIVTQEKVTAPERERELQLLSSEHPEHRTLLQAVEAEAPLAALSHQLLPSSEALPQRPYRSAFADTHVPPKLPPLWKPPSPTLIPKFTRSTAKTERAPRMEPFPGALNLSFPLKERLLSLPKIPCLPHGKSLENPEFLIGVSKEGSVKFLVLQRSSGDPVADVSAEQALRQTLFARATPETEWAEASLVWRSLP